MSHPVSRIVRKKTNIITVSYTNTDPVRSRDVVNTLVQTYKSASGVVKLDAEAEELVKKLSEIEKERASVTLQRKQVEFALAALQEARSKGKVYTPAVFKDDPLIGSMARGWNSQVTAGMRDVEMR